MEDAFVITGGKRLEGNIYLSGAKNIALKVIIAALLFHDKVTILNIPDILDVRELLRLIYLLDGEYVHHKNKVTITSNTIEKNFIDLYHGAKVRTSFMFLAPLLYHFGKARIPNPGGCRLGSRAIDRHIHALSQFGVSVQYDSSTGYFNAQNKYSKLKGCTVRFDKPTHTGTEFAIMLGTVAEGETVIYGASLEPEIDDLIGFLNDAGACIKRKDNHIIAIKGVHKLKQKKPYVIQSDRNVGVTYACCALATKGSVVLHNVGDIHSYSTFITYAKQVGCKVEFDHDKLAFSYDKQIKPSDIVTKPHPGFMTDWQGPWAVLMTQASGVSTIHETIFENRFGYVKEFRKLGARIDFFQPKVIDPQSVYSFNVDKDTKIKNQAIRIYGNVPLHNGVLKVSDLRAGATLVIGAAIAQGESIIEGASIIDRGYEKIDETLRSIGMEIKRI